MKLNKLFIVSFSIFATLTGLVSCNTTNPSNPGGTEYPPLGEDHVCVFDQKVPTTEYRATPSSCGHLATYYYSCICGAKGTETFEYGDSKGHSYMISVGKYKSNYLIGETFDLTSIDDVTFKCEKCGVEEDVDLDDLNCSSDPITSETESVTLTIEVDGTTYTVVLPVYANIYTTDKVDIYVGQDNRVYFGLEGSFGAGFEENVREAELYLTVNNDYYKFASANPTVNTTTGGYGTFKAEIDITDMYFSNRELVITEINTSAQFSNVLFSHFVIENDLGVITDRDLKFDNLEMKEITRPNDPAGESYVLNLCTSNNKNIPVVARATSNPLPDYTYYYTQTDTTYTFPTDVECGYMPVLVDIENVNDRAIWSISGKFKGFTRKEDFFRCFAIFIYKYPSNTDETDHYFNINGHTTNHSRAKDDFVVNFETTNSGTFTIKVDITNFALSDSTKPGYYTRMHDVIIGGTTDAKNADASNNNKAITIGDRVYTIVNVAPSVKPGNTNSWGTMGFKITNA